MTIVTINKPVGYALEILTRVRADKHSGTSKQGDQYTKIERSYVEAAKKADCLAAAIAEVSRLNGLETVVASRYVLPYLIVTKPVMLQGRHVTSKLGAVL